jgi:hypothetical protein
MQNKQRVTALNCAAVGTRDANQDEFSADFRAYRWHWTALFS